MTLRIRLPKISTGLIGNIIGFLGLILIVLSVGGLTHNWWWGALTAGFMLVGIAYMIGLESSEEVPEGE